MPHQEIAPGVALVGNVKGWSIRPWLTAWAQRLPEDLRSILQTAASLHPAVLGSSGEDKLKRSHRKKAQHVVQCWEGRYRMQMDSPLESWDFQEVLMVQKGSIMGLKGISFCRNHECHVTLLDWQCHHWAPAILLLHFPADNGEPLVAPKAGHCFYLERDRFAERLIPSLYLFFIGFSFVNLLCTVAAVTLLSIFICIF